MRVALIVIIITFFGCQKDNTETIQSKPLEVSDNEIINYISYCNNRFDACFDYPSNFGAQPEPANGDGRTFLNELDSAQIVMYGFLDDNNEGLKTQINILNEYLEIEKLTDIPNGYELIGKDKESGKIHKERILIKPDSSAGKYKDGKPMNIIYSLQFVYPQSKEKKYQNYWHKMTEKFN